MQKRYYRSLAFCLVMALLLLLFSGRLAHDSAPGIDTSYPQDPISTIADPALTHANPIPAQQNTSSLPAPIQTPPPITSPDKSAYDLWLDSTLNSETTTTINQPRFYKVNQQGQLLTDDRTHWACVYDANTGLLWEVKANDGSWQDYEHTYTWYKPVIVENSASALLSEEQPPVSWGVENGGRCYDVACDTYHYALAVNEERLCQSSDWRLPYAYELASLDHPSHYSPDIDTDYFPYTAIGSYWSQTQPPSVHATNNTLAWRVNFVNGFPYISEKRLSHHVRLVADALWLDEQLFLEHKKSDQP